MKVVVHEPPYYRLKNWFDLQRGSTSLPASAPPTFPSDLPYRLAVSDWGPDRDYRRYTRPSLARDFG